MNFCISTNLQIIWNTLQTFKFNPVRIIFIHFFICMHTLHLIYVCVHICVYWKNNKVFWKCKLTERVSVCDTCAMRQYQSFEFFLQSGPSIHCSYFYGCDIVLFLFFIVTYKRQMLSKAHDNVRNFSTSYKLEFVLLCPW